ncbi:unnamed protein product [Phytomonas sp. Hart1]|nr:unnamed protein product [Phytomonas sp. Hart1]|eukprot:CCW66865.1 unnamed protein product [Phytomonas sp. isolate Hart1]
MFLPQIHTLIQRKHKLENLCRGYNNRLKLLSLFFQRPVLFFFFFTSFVAQSGYLVFPSFFWVFWFDFFLYIIIIIIIQSCNLTKTSPSSGSSWSRAGRRTSSPCRSSTKPPSWSPRRRPRAKG